MLSNQNNRKLTLEKRNWLSFSFFVIALSVLAASFLIFSNIGIVPFWLDEAAVANTINISFFDLLNAAIQDSHSIVYIYVIKSWSLFFGDSEVALRSFSALFALLFVPLMFNAAKFIFNSSRAGELAAILASTNYFLIFYGTQNRPYTFLAWLSLCSFFCFLRWFRKPNLFRTFLYVLFTVLGFFTHPWFFLIFGVEGLIFIVFLKNQRELFKMIFIFGLMAILSIPAIMIYWQQSQIGINDWIGRVDWGVIFKSLKMLAYRQTWSYVTITTIAVIMFFCVYRKNNKTNQESDDYFINSSLIIYLLTPLIVALVISRFKPIYQVGRYEIVVLPAILLLFVGWWRRLVNRKTSLITIGFILFSFSYYGVVEQQKLVASYKYTDKSITQYVLNQLNNSGGGKVVVTGLNWATFHYYSNHYSKNIYVNYKLYIYPSEVSDHPGWIKNSGDSFWQKKIKSEAEQLASQLVQKPNENVWLILSDEYKLNSYLFDALDDRKFILTQRIIIEEPRQPTQMDQIVLLKLKVPPNSP